MDTTSEQVHERMARAVQRLGELIITRPLDDPAGSEIAERLEQLSSDLEKVPPQSKSTRFGGRNRVQVFTETGEWPPPPDEGAVMNFDIASIVGGALHPFSIGTEFRREGNESVGRVVVSRCFEGPPGRVHGGILCAIFDEVMGSVFEATGTPSAFTGELSVRFEGPAPLEVELEFRAREVKTEGRKRFLRAEASGPNGRFASASGVFIDLRPEDLPTSVL